jgi:hypothetical protein
VANFGGKGGKGSRSGKKFGLQFKGWEEMMTNLDELSHFGVLEGTKKALTETHKVVTPKLEAEIRKHRLTGATEASLVREPRINVVGTMVSIDIGFDLDKGGLPSIWLMHGTPRITPDKALYEALYGRKTAGEVAHVQYHAIKDTIDKYMSRS